MFIVYRRPFKDGEPSTVYEFEHGEVHGPFKTYDEALEYANNLPYWKVITWGFALMSLPLWSTRMGTGLSTILCLILRS
ncbi:MAG: hypothetical protein CM15mV33_240 [uncultured marine virus]|nr:MAG: hypothetical protein CM15mV33_240 [uncultured marine virus]